MSWLHPLVLILWLIAVVVYFTFPGWILRPAVMFPLVVAFSTLLPVSFWHLQRAGKRIAAAAVAGILVVDVVILAIGMLQSHSGLADLDRRLVLRIDPVMADMTFAADTAEERQMAARVVFRRHGTALAFVDGSGSLRRFSPDDEDKGHFFTAAAEKMKIQRAMVNAVDGNTLVITLTLLHMGLFVAVLLVLVLYDRPSRWPIPKVTAGHNFADGDQRESSELPTVQDLQPTSANRYPHGG